MTYLVAECERVQRSIVTVDITKLLASDWGTEREKYDSDEEFAKDVLRRIGTYDLLEPEDEDENGITVEGEGAIDGMTFLGVRS